mgnify:CR=1 FL=1
MTTLKQCPFCASTSIVLGMDHNEYIALCLNCGAHGPNETSMERSAKMWNMRRDKIPDKKGFLFTEEQEKTK